MAKRNVRGLIALIHTDGTENVAIDVQVEYCNLSINKAKVTSAGLRDSETPLSALEVLGSIPG